MKKKLIKGEKFDQGKPPIHMIPEDAIIGMAQAFAYGARKYDRFNYRNGIDYTRLIDSLMRHTLAYSKREDIDEESGLPHTFCILANAAMLEFMRVNKKEHDDRYVYDAKEQAPQARRISKGRAKKTSKRKQKITSKSKTTRKG